MIGTTLLFIIVAAFIALLILFKGPSDTAKKEAVNTFTEMSAMKWVPKMFLSADEVQRILDASRMVEVEAGTVTNLDLIDTTVSTASDSQEPIEIQDVTGSSYKGKLMIIRDPSKVFLGTVPEFYEGPGEVVADIISHYPGAVAGVNGGDFVDMGSYSYTAQPLGAIISNGEVAFCAGDYEGIQTETDIGAKMLKKAENPECKYKKSAKKISFMVRRYEEDGFTSYWL